MKNYDLKDVDCLIFFVKNCNERIKISLFDMTREQALELAKNIQKNNNVVGIPTIYLKNGNII